MLAIKRQTVHVLSLLTVDICDSCLIKFKLKTEVAHAPRLFNTPAEQLFKLIGEIARNSIKQ